MDALLIVGSQKVRPGAADVKQALVNALFAAAVNEWRAGLEAPGKGRGEQFIRKDGKIAALTPSYYDTKGLVDTLK